MNNNIIETINNFERPGDFNHAYVSDEMICIAENSLGVKLPKQYIDFLKIYSHGGIAGIETIGVGLTGELIFVEVSLDYRNEELPYNFVVIENIDEWLNCIDCNTGRIVSWDYSVYIKDEYSCFDEYLIDLMNDAIENIQNY